MKGSERKVRQDYQVDTENENRPEGPGHIIVILGLCFLLID